MASVGVQKARIMGPGVNVSLPLCAPGYFTHLWGPSWRDPNEQFRAPVLERFLTLSGAILERVDDRVLRRASRKFPGLLLPQVMDVPVTPILGSDSNGTWRAQLAYQGLPPSAIADRLRKDAAFGMACGQADSELGLSASSEIDPAVCLLWELYPSFVSASGVGGWAGRFAAFVAEAAYYWTRQGETGIDDIAGVFVADSARFYRPVPVGSVQINPVSPVHMVARIVARLREDVVPMTDPRVQAIYRRGDHGLRGSGRKGSWMRWRPDPRPPAS
jgi:hypothetical protein